MKDVVQQIQITVVPPAVVDVVWPDAKEMLLRAVEATRGVYDIDSVERGLASGEFVLWLVLDGTKPIAALTTRICDYPTAAVWRLTGSAALAWPSGYRWRNRSWSSMLRTTAALISKGMVAKHGGGGSKNTGGSPPI
jgi:hypothetical protein